MMDYYVLEKSSLFSGVPAAELREDLEETLRSVRLKQGKGVFMDVLTEMLEENGLKDRVIMRSLFASEPDKCLELIGKD